MSLHFSSREQGGLQEASSTDSLLLIKFVKVYYQQLEPLRRGYKIRWQKIGPKAGKTREQAGADEAVLAHKFGIDDLQ